MSKDVVSETPAVEEAAGVTLGNPRKATESFVYMDHVKEILDIAMKTEKNVILYGPGGYGRK